MPSFLIDELLGIINKIWSHLKERSREQIQGTSLSSTSESLFSFAQSVMKMRRRENFVLLLWCFFVLFAKEEWPK